MNKRLVIYCLLLALLMVLLKVIEYQFVLVNHSFELYAGTIALVFIIVGIIAGRKSVRYTMPVINHDTNTISAIPVPATIPQITGSNEATLEKLNISKREYEILQLMAEGLSNQEIAERTFVSIHTVKTHVSNLLLKLDAKRRTQAVIKARELNII